MNKKSVQKIVVGGVVTLGVASAATSITAINRNVALQQALKDTQEELDNRQ